MRFVVSDGVSRCKANCINHFICIAIKPIKAFENRVFLGLLSHAARTNLCFKNCLNLICLHKLMKLPSSYFFPIPVLNNRRTYAIRGCAISIEVYSPDPKKLALIFEILFLLLGNLTVIGRLGYSPQYMAHVLANATPFLLILEIQMRRSNTPSFDFHVHQNFPSQDFDFSTRLWGILK